MAMLAIASLLLPLAHGCEKHSKAKQAQTAVFRLNSRHWRLEEEHERAHGTVAWLAGFAGYGQRVAEPSGGRTGATGAVLPGVFQRRQSRVHQREGHCPHALKTSPHRGPSLLARAAGNVRPPPGAWRGGRGEVALRVSTQRLRAGCVFLREGESGWHFRRHLEISAAGLDRGGALRLH